MGGADGTIDGENDGVKTQFVAAAISDIIPTGHRLHDEAPKVSEKYPGIQGLQAVAPGSE